MQVHLDRLAQAVAERMPELTAAQRRIALGLYRLLAGGRPVSPGRLARSCGLSEEEVRAALAGWPGVFWEGGAVVGFWGLALPEMAHRFEVEGRHLFTWCAFDALFIPGLIERRARVESRDPVTGEAVSLTVAPDGVGEAAPQGIHVSFLAPGEAAFDENVIVNFCSYVHFFASAESGAAWVEGHPGTFLLSLEDAVELARRTNRARYGEALEPGGVR